MTVSELITKLQALPQDLPVWALDQELTDVRAYTVADDPLLKDSKRRAAAVLV